MSQSGISIIKLRSEAEFRTAWVLNEALEIYNTWCRYYDTLPPGFNMTNATRLATDKLNERMGPPR